MYFPLFLNLSDRPVVVYGGGTIALRRIRILLEFRAEITVYAPEAEPELEQMEKDRQIRLIRKAYGGTIPDTAGLVLAATNDSRVNEDIVRQCRKMQAKGSPLLVNRADDKSQCDFHFPSVVRTGEITLGISSSGSDCKKVRQFRKKLEEITGAESLYEKRKGE